jgi:hypothetical protein
VARGGLRRPGGASAACTILWACTREVQEVGVTRGGAGGERVHAAGLLVGQLGLALGSEEMCWWLRRRGGCPVVLAVVYDATASTCVEVDTDVFSRVVSRARCTPRPAIPSSHPRHLHIAEGLILSHIGDLASRFELASPRHTEHGALTCLHLTFLDARKSTFSGQPMHHDIHRATAAGDGRTDGTPVVLAYLCSATQISQALESMLP